MPVDRDAALGLLRDGEIAIAGRMPWSSNATFLVDLCHDEVTGHAIYKPIRGERPLWDFPPGLAKREVAAWELSEALGWEMVPATVLRDGPLGEGSVQQFIDADFEQHYFTLLEDERYHAQLRRMAAFDIVANNTDRKGGHCLLASTGHVYGIDHGLAFHEDFKLRTVIWDFGGEVIPDDLLDDMHRLLEQDLPAALTRWLSAREADALRDRTEALLAGGRFPIDRSGRQYPWPLV